MQSQKSKEKQSQTPNHERCRRRRFRIFSEARGWGQITMAESFSGSREVLMTSVPGDDKNFDKPDRLFRRQTRRRQTRQATPGNFAGPSWVVTRAKIALETSASILAGNERVDPCSDAIGVVEHCKLSGTSCKVVTGWWKLPIWLDVISAIRYY
jgi:hypothetical protein